MADRARLRAIAHELKVRPPKILAKTRRIKGAKAAERQRRAILLSKYRGRSSQRRKAR